MKAKNQANYTSDVDAKDKLIVFVYEYLVHSGAKQAADKFIERIGYNKNIEIKDQGPGFLLEWWCVFWDLYCATPEKRHLQPEPSPEARAYHDFMRSAPMSPSIAQTSPPQQQQPPPPPPQFLSGPGGPRHHGPHAHPHSRGQPQPPRMQAGPQHPQQTHHQHGAGPPPPPGGPPGGFMQAVNPRYRQHQGPPLPPPPHMNQAGPPHGPPPPIGYGPGHGPPPDRMGQSPGGMNPMPSMGNPPLPPPMVGGMTPNQQQQQQDDYVVPDGYDQQSTDQTDAGSEIRMLKESLESDANDGDQSSFNMDFGESQGKW